MSVRAGQAGKTSNLTSCGAVVQCVEVEIEFNPTADEFVRQQSDLTAEDLSKKMDPCQAMTMSTRVAVEKQHSKQSKEKHFAW